MSDTQEYRNVKKYKKLAELKSIQKVKRSGIYFQEKFKQFPQQYRWNILGKDLNIQTWLPKQQKPRALIIYYPCFAGHAGLSAFMAEQLSKLGFIFTTFDYPNFGKSETTQRGYVESYEKIIEFCQNFLIQSKEQYPNVPIYIMGFSAGSLLAIQASITNAQLINGCIFINPFFENSYVKKPFINKLMLLGSAILPKIQRFNFKNDHDSSHYLERYKQKDKFFQQGSLSGSRNTLHLMTESRFMFQKFNLPYLCIQGGTDKVVNPFVAFDFEKQSQSTDKQTVIIHDMWHGVWFDDRLKEVVQMSKQWINQRI